MELLLVLFSLLEEDLPVSASSDDSTSFSAEDSIFLEELLDSSSQSLQIEDEDDSAAAFSSGPLLEADEVTTFFADYCHFRLYFYRFKQIAFL